MASRRLREVYQEIRRNGGSSMRVGYSAVDAWVEAKTRVMWDALEAIGAVRLRAEYDGEASAENAADTFGSIGEFWIGDGPWQHGDSVWGHVGYGNVLDPTENPYITDIMFTTINRFREAWKTLLAHKRDLAAGRCPACHGTGRHVA
jgi:hypothetical protein